MPSRLLYNPPFLPRVAEKYSRLVVVRRYGWTRNYLAIVSCMLTPLLAFAPGTSQCSSNFRRRFHRKNIDISCLSFLLQQLKLLYPASLWPRLFAIRSIAAVHTFRCC